MSDYDVAILGSGMGGSTFAYALRDSGLKVLVIDRGGHLEKEPANWDTNVVFADKRYHNAESWYDGKSGKAFKPGVFYYVGGNTKFYGAMLPRFRAEDFGAVKHAEGISPAWPIAYADLEPWYCRAEALFRVHGTPGMDPCDPPRSRPFPYPALDHDPALLPLVASLERDGLKPFAMPAGVDYAKGRPCILCSTCDGYPCKVDAKQDAEISSLRPALASASIELLTHTRIDRLETSLDGTRIVSAIGLRNGEPIRIEAKRFVMALGAVNSAALLLRSANSQHPCGLANSSDRLGRNYMVHNSTFMLAVDPRRVNKVSFQKTLALNDWYLGADDYGFPLGNVQMLGKIRAPMVTGMRPWLPNAIARYVTDHSVDLYLTSEDLPVLDNRVTWDADKQAIKVFWTPNNLPAHEGLVAKTKRALKRAGYPIILADRMGIGTNSHQCGTAVMGSNPASSVLDTNCRSHDVGNLWLVDSSPFVSAAAVNPALTIAANALRVASVFATT